MSVRLSYEFIPGVSEALGANPVAKCIFAMRAHAGKCLKRVGI